LVTISQKLTTIDNTASSVKNEEDKFKVADTADSHKKVAIQLPHGLKPDSFK